MNQDSLYLGPEMFRAYVFEPGTLFHAPKIIADDADVEPLHIPADPISVANTLWVGVRDPSDASRFFISFRAECGSIKYEGIFKGWLDDEEHIHLADTSANSNWMRYVTEVERVGVLMQ